MLNTQNVPITGNSAKRFSHNLNRQKKLQWI